MQAPGKRETIQGGDRMGDRREAQPMHPERQRTRRSPGRGSTQGRPGGGRADQTRSRADQDRHPAERPAAAKGRADRRGPQISREADPQDQEARQPSAEPPVVRARTAPPADHRSAVSAKATRSTTKPAPQIAEGQPAARAADRPVRLQP